MSKTTLISWVFLWMKRIFWSTPAGVTGTIPMPPRKSCTTGTPPTPTTWIGSEGKLNG